MEFDIYNFFVPNRIQWEPNKNHKKLDSEIEMLKNKKIKCPICKKEMKLKESTEYGHGESIQIYTYECRTCPIKTREASGRDQYEIIESLKNIQQELDKINNP